MCTVIHLIIAQHAVAAECDEQKLRTLVSQFRCAEEEGASLVPASQPKIRELFVQAALRSPRLYLDSSALITLIRCGGNATPFLGEELAASAAGDHRPHEAILWALGVLQDSESIPFLRRELQTCGPDGLIGPLADGLLSMQPHAIYDVQFERIFRLQDVEEWSRFLRELHASAHSDDDAFRVMQVMATLCFDRDTVEFFHQRDAKPDASARERLQIAKYLCSLGEPIDDARLESTVSGIAATSGFVTADDWHSIANVPHECVIPHLIGILSDDPESIRGRFVLAALRFATLRIDLAGRRAWEEWYVLHSGWSREDIIRESLQLLATNAESADVIARMFASSRRLHMPGLYDEVAHMGLSTGHEEIAVFLLCKAFHPARQREVRAAVDRLISSAAPCVPDILARELDARGLYGQKRPLGWDAFLELIVH